MEFDKNLTKNLSGNSLFSFWMITHNNTLIQLEAPDRIEQLTSGFINPYSYKLYWYKRSLPLPISREDLRLAMLRCILIDHNGLKIFDAYHKPKYHFIRLKQCEYDPSKPEYTINFDTYSININMATALNVLLRNINDEEERKNKKMPTFTTLREADNFIDYSDYSNYNPALGRAINRASKSTECYVHTATNMPAIRNIIYNEPYTIVKWDDGKTTKVGCKAGEVFDKEVGLAMAIARRYFESMSPEQPRRMFKNYVRNAKHYIKQSKHKKLLPAANEGDE
jgi:hypothetical protein